MQTMDWLETHLGSIEEAVEVINQFSWDITLTEANGTWYVMTGKAEKHTIFSANSREAVDAFLYGMGLAYIGIPSPLFERLSTDVKEWHDNQ